jgi:ubiquinone/menaquinone biosynthesis C-methylase UbiE
LFLFGFKYKCIFCKGHFRKLFPIGLKNDIAMNLIGGGYRYALCPRCHSTDRERLIYWYIVNKTNILNLDKTINLLHVAPERNLQKILRSFSYIEYISGDLNPSTDCDIRLDITNINFEDNFFDVIICNHVLEHIIDDRKAISELFRVLRPGGFAILQVPISKNTKETFEDFSITSPEERERYFGQKDHIRIYGKDYKNRLESTGFKVELYDIKNDLSIQDIKKYGLNEEEILYIGYK